MQGFVQEFVLGLLSTRVLTKALFVQGFVLGLLSTRVLTKALF